MHPVVVEHAAIEGLQRLPVPSSGEAMMTNVDAQDPAETAGGDDFAYLHNVRGISQALEDAQHASGVAGRGDHLIGVGELHAVEAAGRQGVVCRWT